MRLIIIAKMVIIIIVFFIGCIIALSLTEYIKLKAKYEKIRSS